MKPKTLSGLIRQGLIDEEIYFDPPPSKMVDFIIWHTLDHIQYKMLDTRFVTEAEKEKLEWQPK